MADLESLKKSYINIVSKFEEQKELDKWATKIPKIVAPFQFKYRDLYQQFIVLQDKLDALFYRKMENTKMQNTELSYIKLNSTELKQMIESSEEYRKIKREQEEIQADMKLVEEMTGTIKGFGYSITNAIRYKEFMYGKG